MGHLKKNQRNFKISSDTCDNENTESKTYGTQQSQFLEGRQQDNLTSGKRKFQIKKPNLTPKASREKRKPKVIRMKEIIKIRQK